jgi:pimeloyl-ACP methyl ester carboxylesterase
VKRLFRSILIVLAALLALILVVPFLIPVPPLKDTLPPEQLADPDSLFADIGDVRIHYKLAGHGAPALVLLHGLAASTFSWREVMAPLSERGTVIAFDRPSSGLTSRPLAEEWQGENPYTREAQADQTIALLDRLGIQKAILVGNSAGGTIAALTALRHPERVQALILVDAAIYSEGGPPDWIRPLLHTPQARRLGPLVSRFFSSSGDRLLRLAWHDPSKIKAEALEGYRTPLRVQNWDRAFWEFTLASRSVGLPERLGQITIPALVITGDDDRIVPTAESIRLAKELPNARLEVIPSCGHVPHEECPEAFLKAVNSFLDSLR